MALAIGSLLFMVWQVLDVLLLLFAGLLMGLFLSTLADWLHQHARLPRGVALALVVLTLFGAIVLAVWLSGPALAEQADQLREQIPSAVDRLRERVARYDIGHQLLNNLPDPGKLFSDRGAFLTRATGIVSGALGALGTLFVIVLFGIFIAAEPGTYVSGLVKLATPARRERLRAVLNEAGSSMRLWLVSKVVRMIFIGIATWAVLRFLGVPVAALLALIAALLSFVPNFGPITAAIPAVLLALVQGLDTALWVILLYVTIQVVEGDVLDPLLTKKIVSIPPGLTFGVQVVLGTLAGPVGLAVATPFTAACVVLVHRLYVDDVLGSGDASAGGSATG
ncbi:MAG: AI-2E family transporter [Gemmatimonadaceae bacterium]